MPGRILPIIPLSEITSRNSAQSCYVTVGTKVYDVTSFLPDHPGGADLVLGYGGKDVTEILKDEISHRHSEAAYEVLADCLVGFLALETTKKVDTGSSGNLEYSQILPCATAAPQPVQAIRSNKKQPSLNPAKEISADNLSVETDMVLDYKTHKFLDLSRPLLPQVWNGGFTKEFYLEQVHRPRHYRSGDSAPLFGNFLEPLSKTAWWVVPLLWLPSVMYGTYYGSQGLSRGADVAFYWLLGLGLWTLVEYAMHRCLFHADRYLPDNRVGITAHFLLHGIHHYLPMDRYRLVMPPTLFLALAQPFYKLAQIVFFYNRYAAIEVFSGGVFGYVCYDLTHYFLHHRNLPSYYKTLKKYHLQHHFADYDNGFGVTSRFWDWVFGTQLKQPKAVSKT